MMKNILIFSWLLSSFLVFSAISSAAESDVDKLLDLLVEKKVLSIENAAAFRADLAVNKQEEKEKQKEFIAVAGKPIKISGYTQARYRNDGAVNDTFDIRRARLDIKGDITERFDYRSQIEFGAGTSSSYKVLLLDAILGYKVNPYLKLQAGQFFIPFSQENLTSNTKLESINRSQAVEALAARSADVIGNQNGRDIGFQASGSIFPKEDYNYLDYALGIFNGSGINTTDTNEQKDVAARLVFHPLKNLSVGSSYYLGKYTLTSAPAAVNTRDRIGVEFAYLHGPISLKGEYIKGKDISTNKDGWYLQAGYFVIPKKLQGLLKVDTYDPNTKLSSNETDIYTFGGNWYFNKWAFLQLNYELKDEQGAEVDNNALTGQLTLQF